MQHHAGEAFVDVYNLIEMHGFLWGRPPPLLRRRRRCFRSGGSSVANDVMIGRYDAEGQDFFSALVDTTPSAPRIVFSPPPPNDSDDDDNDDDDDDDDDEEEKRYLRTLLGRPETLARGNYDITGHIRLESDEMNMETNQRELEERMKVKPTYDWNWSYKVAERAERDLLITCHIEQRRMNEHVAIADKVITKTLTLPAGASDEQEHQRKYDLYVEATGRLRRIEFEQRLMMSD